MTPSDREDRMSTPSGEANEEIDENPIADVSVRRIEVINLAILVCLIGGGYYYSLSVAAGVALGGILMAANFRIISMVMASVFGKGSASLINVGTYWVKFLVLMVLIGFLVLYFKVDIYGLLVGLSTILVAVSIEAVLRMAGR